MNAKESHFFARGNTAHGAHFLYFSAFQGLEKLIVLTGPSGTGKSTVLRSIADTLRGNGQHVQCFHSPLRPNELDGIIATELNIGILDGDVCEGIPSAGESLSIHFAEAIDYQRISSEVLKQSQSLIKSSLRLIPKLTSRS
ncbi:AAA family ATPase [Paenibacillus cremeus]|uniref:AAA family ATPase n=1 Tax=Paenibacillus cremeus TaxID=2163881 RepID=UPI0021BDB699|nr:AAA family ATPase [Paenibacillus cremeus]